MSFLNQSVLQKKAAMAAVEKHPLLKECDVPLNVRQTYLQGCVLAVLERDDGKVTETARQEISELGLSLEMSNEDIKEAISVVSKISSPEAQDDFLGELFVALSGEVYPRYFLKDFEGLLTKGGSVSANTQKTLDYFGSSLTGKKDWRSAVVVAVPVQESAEPKPTMRVSKGTATPTPGPVAAEETVFQLGGDIIRADWTTCGSLINPSLCIQCGACRDVCPAEAIDWTESGTLQVDGNKCVGCGCCIDGCPMEAILSGESHPVPNRVAGIIVQLLDLDWSQVTWDAAIVDDLGGYSCDAVLIIVMALGEEFAHACPGGCPEEDAVQMRTVGDIVRYMWWKGCLTAQDF